MLERVWMGGTHTHCVLQIRQYTTALLTGLILLLVISEMALLPVRVLQTRGRILALDDGRRTSVAKAGRLTGPILCDGETSTSLEFTRIVPIFIGAVDGTRA